MIWYNYLKTAKMQISVSDRKGISMRETMADSALEKGCYNSTAVVCDNIHSIKLRKAKRYRTIGRRAAADNQQGRDA